jgi:hypothetical protein
MSGCSSDASSSKPEPLNVPAQEISINFDQLVSLVPNNNGYYTVVLEQSEISAPTDLMFDGKTVTLIITSAAETQTISLYGTGPLFTVHSGINLVLENIKLKGTDENTSALIVVESGGTLTMHDGSVISGNFGGAGVLIRGGTFNMQGGNITSNLGGAGGGVTVENGKFALHGGIIDGNLAENGGGVAILNGEFLMEGGTISSNLATNGGGVYINSGTLTVRDGIIKGNNATLGGGVYVGEQATFIKTADGGVIYGAGEVNSLLRNNAAKEGHAIRAAQGTRANTVSGGVIVDSTKAGAEGGWDQ